MRSIKKIALGIGILIIAVLISLFVLIQKRYGGGTYLENRSTDPILSESALEVVADLEYPPGNVAVSRTGRVFFTYHPDAGPPVKVLELVDGKPLPYPDASFQVSREGEPFFDTVLSLRIDSQNRLWTLDFARHGQGIPRLLAFDLSRNVVIHEYRFSAESAGFGSMLNDLQIDPAGEKIYIADTSAFANTPAIIVYDSAKRTARRLLEDHPSVQAKKYIIRVAGRDFGIPGISPVMVSLDSIALDRRGEWLYYGAMCDDTLYRIRISDLNAAISEDELAGRIEVYAKKTLSDGITTDLAGNVYISDMENFAVHRIGTDRRLQTLVTSPRIRWPDGFSFGPGGWLYVTCSSLHLVFMASSEERAANAPYQIFRFKPGSAGVPGQ